MTENNLVMVWSPSAGVGKTTIASLLAYQVAQKGYIVGLIELERYCATTPYILSTGERNPTKSLKNAIDQRTEREILNNFVQSDHSEGLFYLSLNSQNQLDDLYRYPEDRINNVIVAAKSRFDFVILDTPSNYIETAMIATLNAHPKTLILIMDNNLVTWHKLKLNDIFIGNILPQLSFEQTICVVNKDEKLLSDGLINKLTLGLNKLAPKEIFKLPYHGNMIRNCNEGTMPTESTFTKTLKSVTQSILTEPKKDSRITIKL